MSSIITTKNLIKVYKVGTERVIALNNINLSIEDGEVCCILGTSGSGKSTLLNMLAGLEKPTRGQILIGGTDIVKLNEKKITEFRRKYIGFVFQSYNLMPDLTVLENVAMPLTFRGVRKSKRMKMAQQMLMMVGLGKRGKHKPTQMSGGQQQRVGIARAFVARPKIVFADEPTGNLDTRTTLEVMWLMVQMSRMYHQTLVLVTHDQEIAEYADRIITLVDGKIIKDERNPNPKGRDFPITQEMLRSGMEGVSDMIVASAAAAAQAELQATNGLGTQPSDIETGEDIAVGTSPGADLHSSETVPSNETETESKELKI